MEADKYKVKILHFVNPHLIWVLTKKQSDENIFLYEQIGVHGILPLDIIIDYDGNVKTRRCDEWVPAIALTMRTILAEAVEVWFAVTYLDRTTSIFDDNLHKFGDLFVKMKNGKMVSMREELLDTGFVADDVQHFHQNLNTKLDYITSVTVINKIKQSINHFDKPIRYLENLLNQQTSVHQRIIELEEVAAVNNRETQLQLRKQVNDLNACKDIDEKSAGRACSIKRHTLNTVLAKKLNLNKSQSNSVTEVPSMVINENNLRDHLNNEKINISSNNMENNHRSWEPSIIIKKGKRSKLENTDKAKKFMALGPPGLNPLQYHFKEVSEVTKEKELLIAENVSKTSVVEESEDKKDIFDETDSEVNLKIDSLDISKLNLTMDDSDEKLNASKNSDLNYDKKLSIVDVQNCNVKNRSTDRKMKILKEKIAKMNDSFSTVDTDSTVRKGDDSDSDSITYLVDKLEISPCSTEKGIQSEPDVMVSDSKNNVNPFKNLDDSKSVFVEKLISPTLMVHTKNGNCVQPVSNLRDIPFGSEIHVILQNMSVRKPMRPQTVSWPMILRGHSLFLVSPCGSGKTIGYLPAICRLVSYCRQSAEDLSVTPLSCIILCATAKSVSHVEELCKMFLHSARIFACYAGMTNISISTSLLNGCDILISTPTMLVRLLRDNLGLDLRNLNTFVIDDCERIEVVYEKELKFCLFKVKDMLKNRVNKQFKVQYVVTSRIWCHFMSSLAKKAPDSVVCIAAFQECVLYSKVDTSVEFLKRENKFDAMVKFLQDIDKAKKTVIVCRSDDEVWLIEKMLSNMKFVVYACDSTMTVHDLYSLDVALSEYREPILGLVLVCCDGNLTHLNITDAHYLIHFSLPELFSMFCKRFAVLSDNFPSIFNNLCSNVKIKLFLEDTNVEQLPKILNFIKRCSDNVPAHLDKISDMIMVEKTMKKAQTLVPICNALLTLGECPDVWNCKQRHAIFQGFDEPRSWLPTEGVITFKILHYHSAIHYSSRMISSVTQNGVKKYPHTYSMMSIKLGMYYSKECNRKPQGKINVGDKCAVSLKVNLFARCQVMKILKCTRSNLPNLLLINLIDEEKYEIARDTCLYYLPDELKNVDTLAVQVILSNIAPEDRDITYSKLAENQLRKITETNEDLYMRGKVSLVFGNYIFIETLEACQDLSSLNETVVKSNFRNELLNGHAVNNPSHIKALEKLSRNISSICKTEMNAPNAIVPKPVKILPKPRWAHLENDSHAPVYYLYAKSPELFFVQHVKFQDCLNSLIKDIKKYVTENPEPVTDIKEGDIVLAEFPDNNKCYERARIDTVINNNKVKCFFVDLGDWADVSINKLLSVTEKIITQLPFQAIECRLVGIKPVGDSWSEFSTNWLVDQFYDTSANLKYLFAKRFTKENAQYTDGSKYGIGLIDTYADDVYINKLMIDANLAEENDEIAFLSSIQKIEGKKEIYTDDSDLDEGPCLFGDESKLDRICANVPQNQLCQFESRHKINDKSFDCHSDAKAIISKKDLYVPESHDRKWVNTGAKLDNNENNLVLTNISKIISKQGNSLTSTKNISNNQQAITNTFRSKLLRSVPLVEDDDFDDDRWDTLNPLSMLKNPHGGSNVTPTTEKVDSNKTKIVPPAICYTKVDVMSLKDEHMTSDLDAGIIQSTEKSEKKVASMDTIADKVAKTNEEKTPLSVHIADNKNNVVTKPKPEVNSEETRFMTETKSDHISKESGKRIIIDDVDNVNISAADKKSSLNLVHRDSPEITTSMSITKKDIVPENLQLEESRELRKPKLVWRQTRSKVIIKIQLITEQYNLNIKDKYIDFSSYVNDEAFAFSFELYGVVDFKKSHHSNKGLYIQVNLCKVMPINWFTLNEGYIKKWIVYDVDGIDVSSEEEKDPTDDISLRNNLKLNIESDSDDNFNDDTSFVYKNNY